MKYLSFVLLFLSSSITSAQLKTWDGGASTHNWEDANNWNPNGVPRILNEVVIDKVSVSINANQTVKSILLDNPSINGNFPFTATGILRLMNVRFFYSYK